MAKVFKLTPINSYLECTLKKIPGLETDFSRQDEYYLQVKWDTSNVVDSINHNVELWKKIFDSISRKVGATTEKKRMLGILPSKEEVDVFKMETATLNKLYLIAAGNIGTTIAILEARKKFLDEMICSEDELNIYREATSIWTPVTISIRHGEEYTDMISGERKINERGRIDVFRRWAKV